MRSRQAALAIALMALAPVAGSATSESEYIRAGKRMSARALDARLPGMSVGRWLAGLAAPGTRVAWEANDCGEASGSPADTARDLPVCAAAKLTLRDGGRVYFALAVGTIERGVLRPLEFSWAEIERVDSTTWFNQPGKFVTYLKGTPKHDK